MTKARQNQSAEEDQTHKNQKESFSCTGDMLSDECTIRSEVPYVMDSDHALNAL